MTEVPGEFMQTMENRAQSQLSAELRAILRCTKCRSSLEERPDEYRCVSCGKTFPSVRGVLHHTPDCERAFKSLPQYLKPGGTIAIWLYSAYNKWYRFSDIYRKITHRISPRALNAFFRVAVPVLYHLDRGLRAVPIVGP